MQNAVTITKNDDGGYDAEVRVAGELAKVFVSLSAQGTGASRQEALEQARARAEFATGVMGAHLQTELMRMKEGLSRG